MYFMTCKEFFYLYDKNRKRFFDRKSQKLDKNDE